MCEAENNQMPAGLSGCRRPGGWTGPRPRGRPPHWHTRMPRKPLSHPFSLGLSWQPAREESLCLRGPGREGALEPGSTRACPAPRPALAHRPLGLLEDGAANSNPGVFTLENLREDFRALHVPPLALRLGMSPRWGPGGASNPLESGSPPPPPGPQAGMFSALG